MWVVLLLFYKKNYAIGIFFFFWKPLRGYRGSNFVPSAPSSVLLQDFANNNRNEMQEGSGASLVGSCLSDRMYVTI